MLRFEKYPRVHRYLSGLPRGLSSYPTCLQKASLFRQFIKLAPGTWKSNLPAPLGNLIRNPPPLTAWIPEVHATSVYLGIVDVLGWEDKDFVNRSLAMNRELLQSPLYRILMSVVSPSRLIRGGPGRWKMMHQGIELSGGLEGETSARFTLTFPPRIMPILLVQSYATAFQAALESASARKVTIAVEASSDESAVYRCDWR